MLPSPWLQLQKGCPKGNAPPAQAKYYGVSKNGLALAKEFIRRRDQYIKDAHPIYSVDETGFGRFSYHHRKGWALVGKELRVKKDYARQTSVSVLACASADKWEQTREVKGGVNKPIFCEFIKSLDLPEGSVILLDNASIHKGDEVKAVFKEKGFIRLYVPPYSPWFNPIELCFSIVKKTFAMTQEIDRYFASVTQSHFKRFFEKSINCVERF